MLGGDIGGTLISSLTCIRSHSNALARAAENLFQPVAKAGERKVALELCSSVSTHGSAQRRVSEQAQDGFVKPSRKLGAVHKHATVAVANDFGHTLDEKDFRIGACNEI